MKFTTNLKSAFNFLISISLLFLFIYYVDFKTSLQVIRNLNISIYLFACFTFISGFLISTIRWKILLEHFDIKTSTYKLFLIYFGTSFYNFFSPSIIGGDIARTYHSAKIDPNRTNIISSIMMDRFTGLIALLSITFIISLFNLQLFGYELLLLNSIILIGLFLSIYIIFINNILIKLYLFLNNYVKFSTTIGDKLKNIHAAVISYKNNKSIIFKALWYSFLFQLVSSITFYFLTVSVGIKIPFFFTIFSFFLIQLVTLIPISISGIGVREVSFLYLFSKVGVTTSEIAVLLIAGYSLKILGTLLSGLIVLTLIEKKQMEKN